MRIELTPQQFGCENIVKLADISCGCAQVSKMAWEAVQQQLRHNAAVLNGLHEKEKVLLHSLRLRSIDRSYLAPSADSNGKCHIVYIVIFG